MKQYNVAVLGLGLMGAAVARGFAAAGHAVHVWNRSPEKATALAGQRITAWPTVAEATAAADLVVNLTGQCEQLPETFAGCEAVLAGKHVLNLASGTPANVRATGAWTSAQGAQFASGTILCYPDGIGKEASAIYVGGSALLWEKFGEAIVSIAGRSMFVAEDCGTPNVLEAALVGTFFFPSVAAFIEASRFMKSEGVDPAILTASLPTMVAELQVQCEIAASEMAEGSFPTDQATIATHRRSHRMFVQAYTDAAAPSDIITATLAKLERAAAAGHGESSFNAMALH